MPIPTDRPTWTRRRLAVIVSTLLALVLAGAVAAQADESGQASQGGNLWVSASGWDGYRAEWRSVPAVLQVGPVQQTTGFSVAVGASAAMTMLDDPVGETDRCLSGYYRWRFDSWKEYAADEVNPAQEYTTRAISVSGIHDVPGQSTDHYVMLIFNYECV